MPMPAYFLAQGDPGIHGACVAGRHVAGNKSRYQEDQADGE